MARLNRVTKKITGSKFHGIEDGSLKSISDAKK